MKQNGCLLGIVLRSTVTLAAEVQHGLTPPSAQVNPAMTRDDLEPVKLAQERTWDRYVEECRGLARCYFIVSVIGQLTKPCTVMYQNMQWSQQLEQACTVLEGQEADADACLVAALARLVHVAEKMTAPGGDLEQCSSSQPFIDAENAEMLFGDFISRLPQALQCSSQSSSQYSSEPFPCICFCGNLVHINHCTNCPPYFSWQTSSELTYTPSRYYFTG